MQSMQRQFGKLMNKGPGDNAKISALLNDYDEADRVLAKVIEAAKSWRDAWMSILTTQLAIVTEYDTLYDPIVGASDGHGREAAPTPELQLARAFKLKQAYTDLKDELISDVGSIDERVLRPATDARDCIAPIRKTIKKRENKRLDYERCHDKVTKLSRKGSRTAKEEAALAKIEAELSNLAEEFQIADSHLRETLPPVITATFSLIQPLLAEHVRLQNRLLGMYYTTLHNYCQEEGFPSPPPPMEDVVAKWSADFTPAQREADSFSFAARGKGAHQPSPHGDDNHSRKPFGTPTLAGRDSFQHSSSGLAPSANASDGTRGRPVRIPSTPSTSASLAAPSPRPGPATSSSSRAASPGYSNTLRPTDFTTASVLGQSPGSSPGSSRSRSDYFDSRPPTMTVTGPAYASQNTNIAAKKKPPPPPPPKRIPSAQPDEYVVAQYAFAGQGRDDLSFNEGDRIKIVKKTSTDQDWWVGELAGVRGSFPANYCKAA